MSINLYDVNNSLITDYDRCIYHIENDAYKPLFVVSCRLLELKIGKARGAKLTIESNLGKSGINGVCIGNKDYKFHRLFNIPHDVPMYNTLKIEDKSVDFDKNEFIQQLKMNITLNPAQHRMVKLTISNINFEMNMLFPKKGSPGYIHTNRNIFLINEFGLTNINDLFQLL
jgi:hypothetical protein